MKLTRNISYQTNGNEQLSPVLEKLRQEDPGFKVPDGYFDSLSPRIIDSIKKQGNRSLLRALISQIRKPLVWRTVLSVMIFATITISVLQVKKESTVTATDEWSEINMAYDASYAEEVFLAESNIIDIELGNKNVSYIAVASVSGVSEPTVDEITEYLKDQEIDTDILNEY